MCKLKARQREIENAYKIQLGPLKPTILGYLMLIKVNFKHFSFNLIYTEPTFCIFKFYRKLSIQSF